MSAAAEVFLEPPRPSRAFRRRLERIAREAEARMATMRRAAGRVPPGARRLVAAELLPMAEALADPVVGPNAVEALAAAYAGAHGIGDGLMRECLTCRGLWTVECVPVAAVRITISKPYSLMLALACHACVGLGRAGFEVALGRALERDFFGGGPVEHVWPAAFAPGGRA